MYVRDAPWFLIDLATNDLKEIKGKINIVNHSRRKVLIIYMLTYFTANYRNYMVTIKLFSILFRIWNFFVTWSSLALRVFLFSVHIKRKTVIFWVSATTTGKMSRPWGYSLHQDLLSVVGFFFFGLSDKFILACKM